MTCGQTCSGEACIVTSLLTEQVCGGKTVLVSTQERSGKKSANENKGEADCRGAALGKAWPTNPPAIPSRIANGAAINRQNTPSIAMTNNPIATMNTARSATPIHYSHGRS